MFRRKTNAFWLIFVALVGGLSIVVARTLLQPGSGYSEDREADSKPFGEERDVQFVAP